MSQERASSVATESLTQRARSPFEFKSAIHLLRIERERANTLGELLTGLRSCSEDSIFQHTFRTLEEHHFIKEGFSNDFAHWVYTECYEPALGERLASLDIREFTSLADIRGSLVRLVEESLAESPQSRDRVASSPFYFCATKTLVVPTPIKAHDLPEFIEGLRQVSLHSVHYHFIEARLRRKLESNDFSIWLQRELDLKDVATRLNRIDIYTSTLEGVRQQILRVLQGVEPVQAERKHA
jgi:Family of unknown function (DUF5752)